MMFARWRVGDASNIRIDTPPWTLPRLTRIFSTRIIRRRKRSSSFRTISTLTSLRHSTKPLLPLRRAGWLSSSGTTPRSTLLAGGSTATLARARGSGAPDRTLLRLSRIGVTPQMCVQSITGNGEGGIRTLGTPEGTTVFETVPIDRSGTSPLAPACKRRRGAL